MRVGVSVHDTSPSEDCKAYLGSWDTSVCLMSRVSSLGVKGASHSVVAFSNTVLGVAAFVSPLSGSWALSNAVVCRWGEVSWVGHERLDILY